LFSPAASAGELSVEKSRSQEVEKSKSENPKVARDQRSQAVARMAARALLNFSTAESAEQSENVYENKGRGQKVEELRSREVEESTS